MPAPVLKRTYEIHFIRPVCAAPGTSLLSMTTKGARHAIDDLACIAMPSLTPIPVVASCAVSAVSERSLDGPPGRGAVARSRAVARSLAFYNTTIFWQWMRMPGDIVFAAGALLMAWDFMIKLLVQRKATDAVEPSSTVTLARP